MYIELKSILAHLNLQSQMKIYNTLFLLYGSNISFYGNKISMGTEFINSFFMCINRQLKVKIYWHVELLSILASINEAYIYNHKSKLNTFPFVWI